MKIKEEEGLPDWFTYPAEFRRLVEQGIVSFEPWHLLRGQELAERLEGMSQRYPARSLVPFARRVDCDDVACWERERGAEVVVIHDFASPGTEGRVTYPDFWSWFRQAIEDMIEFES